MISRLKAQEKNDENSGLGCFNGRINHQLKGKTGSYAKTSKVYCVAEGMARVSP